jgi:hypothetical protein
MRDIHDPRNEILRILRCTGSGFRSGDTSRTHPPGPTVSRIRGRRPRLPGMRKPDQAGGQVLQQMSGESPGRPCCSTGCLPGASAGFPASAAPAAAICGSGSCSPCSPCLFRRPCLSCVWHPDQARRQILQQMSGESPGQRYSSAGRLTGAPAGFPASASPAVSLCGPSCTGPGGSIA